MADPVVANAARRTRRASLSSVVSSVMESTDDNVVRDREQHVVRRLSSSARGRALEQLPELKRPGRRCRPVRMFQSMCLSLPLLTPSCGWLQRGVASPARLTPSDSLLSQFIASAGAGTSGRRMTGTLFGFRDGRVALALQANPRCRPALVVELALPTHALLRDLGTTAGARIVLETEKHSKEEDGSGGAAKGGSDTGRVDGWLLDEPIWSMFCNGKRVGYAVRREAREDDIAVLETLWAVSMGGGVLPGRSDVDGIDGEMAYMRGCFEHVIGSPDSESLYMIGPHGGDCPELAIFFVRL